MSKQQLAKIQHNKYFFESRLIAKPDDKELQAKVAEIREQERKVKEELRM